jgi:hypothetical protein
MVCKGKHIFEYTKEKPFFFEKNAEKRKKIALKMLTYLP